MFIIGLVGGVLLYRIIFPASTIEVVAAPYWQYIIAGILV
jgi:ABC-type glucose/galactose transport system permease subunit